MKILHVFGKMDRGGAELRTLELMKATSHLGYRQDFCVLSGQMGELDSSIEALGGSIFRLPIASWSFPIRFIRLLVRGRYDILHSHVHYSSGLLLGLGCVAGVPGRIAHFRSTTDGSRPGLLRRIRTVLLRGLIRVCGTDILAVSESAMKSTWGSAWREDRKCQVIYNGISSPENTTAHRMGIRGQYFIKEDDTVIVHVGRFAKPKNHERCIEIFEHFHRAHENSHLLLVGRGGTPEEAAARERVRSRGLIRNVHFVGEQADVFPYLKAADVMLFPSLWEGMPGAVLEALSQGVPVLASDIPVIRELMVEVDGLRALALDVANDEWTRELAHLLQESADHVSAKFAHSKFSFGTAAEKVCSIWRKYAVI